MNIYIPLPRISSELVSNLLGLAGLLALVVAVGGLTHNPWWSLLAASGVLVGVSFVSHRNAPAAAAAEQRPVAVTVEAPAGFDQAQMQQALTRALREVGRTRAA